MTKTYKVYIWKNNAWKETPFPDALWKGYYHFHLKGPKPPWGTSGQTLLSMTVVLNIYKLLSCLTKIPCLMGSVWKLLVLFWFKARWKSQVNTWNLAWLGQHVQFNLCQEQLPIYSKLCMDWWIFISLHIHLSAQGYSFWSCWVNSDLAINSVDEHHF